MNAEVTSLSDIKNDLVNILLKRSKSMQITKIIIGFWHIKFQVGTGVWNHFVNTECLDK